MEKSRGQLQAANTELTFTDEYGTKVHMCYGPEIPSRERGVLTFGQPVTGDSPSVVLTYAEHLIKKHLGLHEAAKTERCTPKVDPVSAIFKNRAGRAVWVDVDVLAGSEAWRYILPS